MSVTSMQEARRNLGRRTAAAAGTDLAAFATSWQLSLEAASKSPRTVRSYTDSVKALQKFLVAQGVTADVEEVDAEHLRAFLLAEERRTSAPSAAVHFRNLRVFFGWLAREGERTNPRTGSTGPRSRSRPSHSSRTRNLPRCSRHARGPASRTAATPRSCAS